MSGEHCALVADGGVPVVVRQALDDRTLPPTARQLMWHLQYRLDFHQFRVLKQESVAREAGMEQPTVHRMLQLLVKRGYLAEDGQRRPRAYRMPWSRRQDQERAA